LRRFRHARGHASRQEEPRRRDTLVLPRRIGAAEVVRDVPDSEITAALEAMYA
jgi:hypothetical protein